VTILVYQFELNINNKQLKLC